MSGVVIRQFGPMIPGVRCQVRSALACLPGAATPSAVSITATSAAVQADMVAHVGWSKCNTIQSMQNKLQKKMQQAQVIRWAGVELVVALPPHHLQVSLALQATDLSIGNERKADVEVTPEAAQMFAHFWHAHAACPLLGRNKVRCTHDCVMLP